MPAQYGYDAGQPFGDPNQFTRGTREDEIDRFNQWMRTQPFYTDYVQSQGLADRGPDRGFSDDQQRGVENLLREQGINLPGAFHVDSGGNINQKNRTARNVAIAAAIAGGAFAAPAVIGALGAGGAAGGAGAAGAASGAGAAGTGLTAAGTLAATTPSLALGSLAGFAPAATSALGAGAAGAATAAGVGGTLAATTPALSAGTLAPTVAPAIGGAGAGGTVAGGGTLSSLLSNPETYSTLASQLGRLGEGQAGERGDENRYGADLNRALASLFGAEQGASTQATDAEERGKLDRAELGLKAPDVRTRQSILGSLLQEMQPFEVGDTGRIKVPKISGGLTPAALNPAARETGSILQKQAIDALLSGSDIPEPTDFQAARLPAPDLNPYQGPGTGESILSGIGAAGNTFAGVMETLRRQSQGTKPSNGVGA